MPFFFFSFQLVKATHGLTVICSPAFGTRHDDHIAGTKEDGGRFGIAARPTKQEDRGTSNAVGISWRHGKGEGEKPYDIETKGVLAQISDRST